MRGTFAFLPLDRRRPEARLARAGSERVERLGLALPLDAVRDVLRERGAVLEAVAGAAADQPPAVVVRVRRDEEMRVAREAVLADARADDRCAGECGEPARRVGAGRALVLRRREPLERVGVHVLAGAVGRDLHAEAADLAVPVERAVVVGEPGSARPRAVDAEEEDVALR